MRTYLLLAGAALILAAGAPTVLHGSEGSFGPPYEQCTYLFPKSGSALVTDGPGAATGKLEFFEDTDTGEFCFSFKAQNVDTVTSPPLDLSGATPYALVATRADNGVNLVVLGLTQVKTFGGKGPFSGQTFLVAEGCCNRLSYLPNDQYAGRIRLITVESLAAATTFDPATMADCVKPAFKSGKNFLNLDVVLWETTRFPFNLVTPP
jgi:hypothetical protein